MLIVLYSTCALLVCNGDMRTHTHANTGKYLRFTRIQNKYKYIYKCKYKYIYKQLTVKGRKLHVYN